MRFSPSLISQPRVGAPTPRRSVASSASSGPSALPTDADAFIEQLAEDLDDAYQRSREGLTEEHAIHALAARGELPVDRLDALPEPASLTTLRASVDSLMPPADLPDLVLEIAAKTEFLQAFTNDHEPNAQLHDL
jgi:hypothetical protein